MATIRSDSPLLRAERLSFSFGERLLFRDLNFTLAAGAATALVGSNGSGKSTLLECLSGQRSPTRGRLERRQGVELVFLPQGGFPFDETTTVEDHLWAGAPDLLSLRRLADEGDAAAIVELTERDGYSYDGLIARSAEAFDVTVLPRDAPLASLSPGQRKKVELVAVFASPASLLLLDEPTNDLDIDGLVRLEDATVEATRQRRAVLLVSHDRAFVDAVAQQTAHLGRDGLVVVEGGFTANAEHRTREHAAREHRAHDLTKKIRRLEQEARQRRRWSDKKESAKRGAGAAKPHIAKQAKKMMKRALDVEKRLEDQIEALREERPFVERPLNLSLPTYKVPRRTVFVAERLGHSYGSAPLLDEIDLTLRTTDRIALLGTNGSGKSTLLRLLQGAIEPTSGSIQRSPGPAVRFLDQGLVRFFERPILLDNFHSDAWDESMARTHLGSTGLRRERVHLPVEDLSPGERMRAALTLLTLERAEFLLLDEPTNHLDLEATEVLERLLGSFPGGFLLVSHDRQLVAQVAERVVTLEDGALREL